MTFVVYGQNEPVLHERNDFDLPEFLWIRDKTQVHSVAQHVLVHEVRAAVHPPAPFTEGNSERSV
jgi:hypothetical protein